MVQNNIEAVGARESNLDINPHPFRGHRPLLQPLLH